MHNLNLLFESTAQHFQRLTDRLERGQFPTEEECRESLRLSLSLRETALGELRETTGDPCASLPPSLNDLEALLQAVYRDQELNGVVSTFCSIRTLEEEFREELSAAQAHLSALPEQQLRELDAAGTLNLYRYFIRWTREQTPPDPEVSKALRLHFGYALSYALLEHLLILPPEGQETAAAGTDGDHTAPEGKKAPPAASGKAATEPAPESSGPRDQPVLPTAGPDLPTQTGDSPRTPAAGAEPGAAPSQDGGQGDREKPDSLPSTLTSTRPIPAQRGGSKSFIKRLRRMPDMAIFLLKTFTRLGVVDRTFLALFFCFGPFYDNPPLETVDQALNAMIRQGWVAEYLAGDIPCYCLTEYAWSCLERESVRSLLGNEISGPGSLKVVGTATMDRATLLLHQMRNTACGDFLIFLEECLALRDDTLLRSCWNAFDWYGEFLGIGVPMAGSMILCAAELDPAACTGERAVLLLSCPAPESLPRSGSFFHYAYPTLSHWEKDHWEALITCEVLP